MQAAPLIEIGLRPFVRCKRSLSSAVSRCWGRCVKPRLLDLFCGAGGCSVGYDRAGFDVVGVDIAGQSNYPFPFTQRDALEVLADIPLGSSTYAAIHASPPCQGYSKAMRHLSGPKPMLIDETRRLLEKTGLPWIIENVAGAPMPDQDDLLGNHGTVLCGTQFGKRYHRHRWFEASFPVTAPSCRHYIRPAMNPHNQSGRDLMYAEFGRQDPEVIWRKEMGVEWMGKYEGRQAIPPVFTEHIGRQLMAHISQAVAA